MARKGGRDCRRVEVEHGPGPGLAGDGAAVMDLAGVDGDQAARLDLDLDLDLASTRGRALRAPQDQADAELVVAMPGEAVSALGHHRLDAGCRHPE